MNISTGLSLFLVALKEIKLFRLEIGEMKTAIKLPALLALALQGALLTGCLTTQEQRIGRNDGTDSCYVFRQELDSTRGLYELNPVAGVLDNLVGGAKTFFLGGAGGGWSQMVKEQGEEKAAASVAEVATRENKNLQRTQTALKKLVDCRRSEAKAVQSDLSSKKITRAQAETRKKIILVRIDEDYRIAESINKNISNRSGEFQVALKSPTAQRNKQLNQQSATNVLVTQSIGKDTKDLADIKNELGGLDSSALPTVTERG